MPRIASRSEYVMLRGLRHHYRVWGPDDAPLAVALHGWMDNSASFQFLADELAPAWRIAALDWRGFGLTGPAGTDSYEFGDYLGDLDAFLRHVSPGEPVRLIGHSMGGNVSMLYAGVRPERVLKLANLEGLGLKGHTPDEAPGRLALWLDQIASGMQLADYESLDAMAQRLCRNNPRLSPDKAAFLAPHWARQGPDGRWRLLADPAHKIVNRVPYRVDEATACWRRITAPVLWVEAADSELARTLHAVPGYTGRLDAVASLRRATVADAGHMLHHDQPAAVAQLVADFLAQDCPRAAAGPTMNP